MSPRTGVEEAAGSLHIDGRPWTEGPAKLSPSLMAAADRAFPSSWEASRMRARSGPARLGQVGQPPGANGEFRGPFDFPGDARLRR